MASLRMIQLIGLYVVTPGAPDESICGKLSHTNSMSKRCEDRSAAWEQKKRIIKESLLVFSLQVLLLLQT